MTEDEKMLQFGRMVFGLITDVLIMPSSDEAYARRTVTTPDGRGGKHSIEILVARKGVADAMEQAAAKRFDVRDVKGGPKQ